MSEQACGYLRDSPRPCPAMAGRKICGFRPILCVDRPFDAIQGHGSNKSVLTRCSAIFLAREFRRDSPAKSACRSNVVSLRYQNRCIWSILRKMVRGGDLPLEGPRLTHPRPGGAPMHWTADSRNLHQRPSLLNLHKVSFRLRRRAMQRGPASMRPRRG